MNMKPQKPIPQPKGQPQIDLKNASTMRCEKMLESLNKCDNPIFIQGYVIKKLSALVSPTGQEVIAPVQVFNCGSCGEMLDLGGGMDELI
jgi:hypothetical protein